MASKVPTVTISLVRAEVHRRGWEEVGTDDEPTMRYRRGKQNLEVSLSRLASAKFTMRGFMRELDLLDKQAR